MRHFTIKIFAAFVFLSFSCNMIDVYEETSAIPLHQWSTNNRLSFTFTASDTLAYYNIYLVIRHTEAYHFNNIWIDFTASTPGKKLQTQRLNLQLANAKGWLGSSMDDIIEQRVLLFSNPSRLAKGNYTFILQQIMREEPLQNVLNAGVRVEKVVQ